MSSNPNQGLLNGGHGTVNFTKTVNSNPVKPAAPNASKKPVLPAAANLDALAQKYAEKQAELEAERIQLETLRKEADDNTRKTKQKELELSVQNAKKYEDWAKEESASTKPDREKIENYLQLAREAQQEANTLRVELGIAQAESVDETTDEKPSFWTQHYAKAWIVSMVVAVLSIWSCYHFVMKYKTDIDKENATITDPSLKIGNPYDDSSIQGIIYDNLVQFTDIPKLWLFLLILVPPIFFYCLPFVKTKVNPWLDWQAVSPATRLWLQYAFSALIFVASALYHLAGNGR